MIVTDHALHRMEMRMKTPDMEMSLEEALCEEHKTQYPSAFNLVYSLSTDAMFCLVQNIFITPKCLGDFNYGQEGETPACSYCDERNVAILNEFEGEY